MNDRNENQYNGQQRWDGSPQQRIASPMAVASIVCGIIGLFGILTGWFALFFGALALLFAALSKGDNKKPTGPARYGRVIGLIAVLVGVAMILFSMLTILNQYGSFENYLNTYIESFSETYGIDLGGNLSL